MMRMKSWKKVCLAAALCVPVATGIAGFASSGADITPEPPHPAHWPSNTTVLPGDGKPTLLLFAHPFCECTEDTVRELQRILADLGKRPLPAIRVLFFRPDNAGKPGAQTVWKPGESWRQASRLPGVSVDWDDGGREIGKFQAGTSGLILLYSAGGNLLFEGGITTSTRHEGDLVAFPGLEGENYGAARLARVLATGRPATGKPSPVFGCALGHRSSAGT
jgi:hypothetical protein